MKRILLEEYLELYGITRHWYRCTCGNRRSQSLKFSLAMHKYERYRIIRVYDWISR
jgi:hypothetical protein